MLTIEKRLPYDHALDWTQFCWCQGTIYRNTQLIQTHIMYCTPWEEYKQTQRPHRSWRERTTALMWYYSPTKNKLIYQVRANTYDFWLSGQYGKYNSNIFLFHPLDPFLSKMMRCPWTLCFDLLPLQYTDLTHHAWCRYGGSWSIYFLNINKRLKIKLWIYGIWRF